MIKKILKFIVLLILFVISCIIFVFLLSSCNANDFSQMQQASEYRTAQFRSEYAIVRPTKKNSSKLNNKFGSVFTTENHCLYCGSIVYGERCESCGARR